MNKCSFIGRMGANPKFFQANGNKPAFMTFSLAVKRPGGKKDQNGNIITDWLDFVAFGKTAELLNQYVPKGTMTCIDDCIATVDKFNDKNTGQERHVIKFLVRSIDLEVSFASNKNNSNSNNVNSNNNNYSNNNNGASFSQNRNYAPPVQEYTEPTSISDGELPF